MKRASGDAPRSRRAACSALCDVALIAAWTMRSSVTASPSSVAAAWPRDLTITRAQRRRADEQHGHPVAEALELERITRDDDNRHTASGDFAQDAVDLGAGAHVDGLCRLVGDGDPLARRVDPRPPRL